MDETKPRIPKPPAAPAQTFGSNGLPSFDVLNQAADQPLGQKPKAQGSPAGHRPLSDAPKQARVEYVLSEGAWWNKLGRLRKYFFLLFLASFIATYFLKDNFKNVTQIHPDLLNAPLQTSVGELPLNKQGPITFDNDGFTYTLTPLYEYEINGLVVHALKYDNWYSLSRTDKVFYKDLCLMWGENLKDGVYKNESLKIKQDFRFCLFSYSGQLNLKGTELSNNHLVISDPSIKAAVDSIGGGDQVKIKGKLVNVEASVIGTTQKYESSKLSWTTSTARDDDGAGACEVIYVESVEVLKPGNAIVRDINQKSLYGLAAMVVWAVLGLAAKILFHTGDEYIKQA